jgi:elongator complex protein 3
MVTARNKSKTNRTKIQHNRMKQFFKEIISEIRKKNLNKQEIMQIKKKICKKYKINKIPTDIEIFLNCSKNEIKELRSLITKPTRTISGVSPIALMTAPFSCKHGKCIYCPGGIKSEFGNTPQSYTGNEPSAMRGKRNKYDPYLITFNRLEQYIAMGQTPEKCEIIIQGGTFPSFPKKYKEDYIYNIYKALNDFSRIFFPKKNFSIDKYKKFFEMPGDMKNKERVERIQKKILQEKKKNTKNLESEKKINETAKIKCIALCIETRPDYCFEKNINEMIRFGTTRIELGVQNINEKILKKINRGHLMKDVYKATELSKNSLLKVGYHIMPGLPGSSKKKDIEMFKKIFLDQRLKPDALKIYPTIILKGTELYKLWKEKKYKELSNKNAVEIITEAKKYIPKWCRVMRVQRDIPKQAISGGVNITNLRQEIEKNLKEKGIKCRCIRCREARDKKISWKDAKLLREDYKSNKGTEIFLSYEDIQNDLLLGFCRLRIIPESFRKEIKKGDAGIRELHVYGAQALTGEEGEIQHRGIGKKLLAEAEKIAKKEFGSKKMIVISGVGVKEYYKKSGYSIDGSYMSKRL